MNTLEKPTFTQNTVSSSVTSPTTTTCVGVDTRKSDLIEQRRQRQEIGAIWTRQAKSNNMEFFKIRLSRDKLKELLESVTTTSTTTNSNTVELVAFPNNYQESNPSRPSYRIYEAVETNNRT